MTVNLLSSGERVGSIKCSIHSIDPQIRLSAKGDGSIRSIWYEKLKGKWKQKEKNKVKEKRKRR